LTLKFIIKFTKHSLLFSPDCSGNPVLDRLQRKAGKWIAKNAQAIRFRKFRNWNSEN